MYFLHGASLHEQQNLKQEENWFLILKIRYHYSALLYIENLAHLTLAKMNLHKTTEADVI